jgi:hypothetical protein
MISVGVELLQIFGSKYVAQHPGIGVSWSTSTLGVFPLAVMVNAITVVPFLPTAQETQMGSDQKGEGESIGRWYR